MPETVDEWIQKADGDFDTARREYRAKKRVNYDAVCFHTQQCIEKLMKAVLLSRNNDPPRTHNLLYLDRLLRGVCPTWESAHDDLEFLTRTGVAFRYPGEWATRTHAERAMAICGRLREGLLIVLQNG